MTAPDLLAVIEEELTRLLAQDRFEWPYVEAGRAALASLKREREQRDRMREALRQIASAGGVLPCSACSRGALDAAKEQA